ncbi:hypothetical protein JIN77_06470 [Verrucomicrobiaceae bacterium R5-34]|nr:hypothetical protein [Verrucomicrobiaceae bacterium R5-34]
MCVARPSLVIALSSIASVLLAAWASAAEGSDRPDKLAESYRLIGHYQLVSKLRVENSQAEAVVISPLRYRVYSDGMEIRVYVRSSNEDSYTAYNIYRADGIGVAKSSGELEMVAGVQAFNTEGKMLRQISVTRNSLTMVKTPPRSHRVIITRAKAIPVSDNTTGQ